MISHAFARVLKQRLCNLLSIVTVVTCVVRKNQFDCRIMATSGLVPRTLCPASADWESSTGPDPNASSLVEYSNLQVMSPNQRQKPQVAMQTTTTSIMFQQAQEVPVPEDSWSYNGLGNPTLAVDHNEPENRSVRRRTSPESSALRSMRPDSPQKVALKNELANKDVNLALLCQQLLEEQSLAMSELQVQLFLSQDRTIKQMHDKVHCLDLLNEQNCLKTEIPAGADERIRLSNEENSVLQPHIDVLQAELSRVKPSITTSSRIGDLFLDPNESEDLLNFQNAPTFNAGASVYNVLNEVPIFHDSRETMKQVRSNTLSFFSSSSVTPSGGYPPAIPTASRVQAKNARSVEGESDSTEREKLLEDEHQELRCANQRMEREMKNMQWLMEQQTASAATPADSERSRIGESHQDRDRELDQSFMSAAEAIKQESPPRPNAITSVMTVQKSALFRDLQHETKVISAGGNEPVPSSALSKAALGLSTGNIKSTSDGATDLNNPAVGHDVQSSKPGQKVGSTDDHMPPGFSTQGRTLPIVSLTTMASTPSFMSAPLGAACRGNHASSAPVNKHQIYEDESNSFDPLPHIRDILVRDINMCKNIAAISGRGALGTQQAKKVLEVKPIEALTSDGPGIENLSASVASASSSLISGEPERKATCTKEYLHADDKLLESRQLLSLVFRECQRNPVEFGMTEFHDFKIARRNLRHLGENLTCMYNGLERNYAILREHVLAYLKERIVEYVPAASHGGQSPLE